MIERLETGFVEQITQGTCFPLPETGLGVLSQALP